MITISSEVGQDGWLSGASRLESPNCDLRPDGELPSLVIVHAISLPPGEFGGSEIAQLFCNELDPKAHPYFAEIHALRVSSHFLIRRDGGLFQFVPCTSRAWHAGLSRWRGRERCNDFSLGIELEGTDDQPFEDDQYLVLNKVLSSLRRSYPINEVVGHSDVAPGRKTDPGPCFDWSRVVD